MAKGEVKIIMVNEQRYRELYRAQILMEILQDYRNTHGDYDFERFAMQVIQKTAPEREMTGEPGTEA